MAHTKSKMGQVRGMGYRGIFFNLIIFKVIINTHLYNSIPMIVKF